MEEKDPEGHLPQLRSMHGLHPQVLEQVSRACALGGAAGKRLTSGPDAGHEVAALQLLAPLQHALHAAALDGDIIHDGNVGCQPACRTTQSVTNLKCVILYSLHPPACRSRPFGGS